MRQSLLAAGVMFVLLACGADERDPTWTTVETVSADMNRYLKAWCLREDRCAYGGKSFEECNSRHIAAHCTTYRKELSLPGLEDCIEALAKKDCEIVATECFEARREIWAADGVTYAGEGEACSGPSVCGEGFYCDGASQGTCGGRCVAQREEKQTCDESAECRPSLYCDGGRCTPKKAHGEVCEEFDECEGECTSGVCEQLEGKLTDEKCDADFECYSERCADGVCIEAVACFSLKERDHCGGLPGSCEKGLFCDIVCTKALDDGEECVSQTKPACSVGSRCVDSRCEPLLENGEACETPDALDDHCSSYYCGKDGRCANEEPVSCD